MIKKTLIRSFLFILFTIAINYEANSMDNLKYDNYEFSMKILSPQEIADLFGITPTTGTQKQAFTDVYVFVQITKKDARAGYITFDIVCENSGLSRGFSKKGISSSILLPSNPKYFLVNIGQYTGPNKITDLKFSCVVTSESIK